MKKLLIIFLLCGSTALFGQLPLDEWCGEYAGTMYLEFPDKTKDSLQLILTIAPTENPKIWTYRFDYKSHKYGDTEKDYLLVLDEKYEDRKHFVLDEQNGILIDQVLMNNCIYGHYEVLKMDYSTTLRKLSENQLYFELICSRFDRGIKSESEADGDGTVYQVSSNQMVTIQYAHLTKL